MADFFSAQVSPLLTSELPQLLTPADLARFLSVKRSTVYEWSAKGRIRPIRLNGRLRFAREAVLELLR